MSRQPSFAGLFGNAQSPAELNLLLRDFADAGISVPESAAAGLASGAGSPADRRRILGAVTAANADALELRRQLLGLGQSRGSGSRGSSTQRFSPFPVDPSQLGQIEFEGGGQQFSQSGPTLAEATELARRQAITDELLAEQRARALGTIAGRTGADAQAARQILDIPATPGFENLISPEQDRVIRTRIAQESAQRSQLEKFARQPGAVQANIDEMWQQHEQQYPEFAGGRRPQTRAEQLQQMQASELAAYQQAVGDVPLARDSKGQIAVIPGFAEAQRAKGEQLRLSEEAKIEAFEREIERVDFSDPIEPDRDAPLEEVAAYRQRLQHNQRRRQLIHDRFFRPQPQPAVQPDQGSGSPADNPQFGIFQQRAEALGLELVSDQDDFDALDPGQRFIYAGDGEQYEK